MSTWNHATTAVLAGLMASGCSSSSEGGSGTTGSHIVLKTHLDIKDDLSQAKAAAQRAATILSKNFVLGSPIVAKINELRCAGCLTCVKVCPFSVPHIGEKGTVEILAEECRGCGICASECPINAIQLEHFRDEQVLTQIEGILSAQGGG